ncbi:unnamed protein product [Cylicostephanus goldi]|uniref:Uncharacterized protein n=1 Tax=Cylicostephanus goldi TaxID=71465 RepID=A0A3P7NZL6_CYLGO|nr:unnamed protein product [Cylicostephanus goldi]
MEELLDHMDHTLALHSGVTVDQEGKTQTSIDFLTVNGLHFKAVTGERGRCHLMVSPSAIPVPPVTVDRYGNMTSVERAFVPSSLYTELLERKIIAKEDSEKTVDMLDAKLNSEAGLPATPTEDDCPVFLQPLQRMTVRYARIPRQIMVSFVCMVFTFYRVVIKLSYSLADMDFAQTCFDGLSRELLAKVSVSEVCTENTTYNLSSNPKA